jgi:hypothetical protein
MRTRFPPRGILRVRRFLLPPGRGWWLGEPLFRSRFYLYKSRERGRGYGCLQGFYHDSPYLRLLIPEVSCHREERFRGGTEPPRVLCIHASRPRAGGALDEQSICERTGRSGLVARQRSSFEDFLQARAGYCVDSDSQGKVLNLVKKIERWTGQPTTSGISSCILVGHLHPARLRSRGSWNPTSAKTGQMWGPPVIGYGPGYLPFPSHSPHVIAKRCIATNAVSGHQPKGWNSPPT